MNSQCKAILLDLLDRFPTVDDQSVFAAFELFCGCYRGNGKLLVCGNGGSAADSEHIVGELMKGFRSARELTKPQQDSFYKTLAREEADYFVGHLQQGLPAISLVSQSGLLTAYSNDVAPDMIFAQQVFVYGNPADLLLGITTSGVSANVLNALKVARARGIGTILMTGNRNQEISQLADVTIRIDESETYRIQEIHLPVYHALCAAIEAYMF